MTSIKTRRVLLGAALTLLLPVAVQARDDHLRFPVAEGLASAAAQRKIDKSIKLYWGTQKYPQPMRVIGEYTANTKTNAFNKSDKEACDWTFLSAVIELQGRAKSAGGNAVVDIRSVYRNSNLVSETDYECGAGTFVAGVALRGQVVKLPDGPPSP